MTKKQTPPWALPALAPGVYPVTVERARKVRNKPAMRMTMKLADWQGVVKHDMPFQPEKDMHLVPIDDLYVAFVQFQNDSRNAGISPRAHNEARRKFREKLEEWGIADRIDWTDRGAV